MNDPFIKFYNYATIGLSITVGILFAAPLVISNPNAVALLLLPFFGGMGGLAGYRQRNNRVFFYLSLCAVAILSSIIYFNMIKNEF